MPVVLRRLLAHICAHQPSCSSRSSDGFPRVHYFGPAGKYNALVCVVSDPFTYVLFTCGGLFTELLKMKASDLIIANRTN